MDNTKFTKSQELKEDSIMGVLDDLEKLITSGSHEAISDEPDDPKLDIKDIELHDYMLFGPDNLAKNVFKVSEIITLSSANKFAFDLMNSLFCDVAAAKWEVGPAGWRLKLEFKFMPNKEYEEEQDGRPRAITSTYDPTKKMSSIAEGLLLANKQQSMSSVDVNKYSTVSQEAKEYLTSFLWMAPGNKKRKWIPNENYTIRLRSSGGFNGAVYNNIVGEIYLDISQVLKLACAGSLEKGKKYEFTIGDPAVRSDGQEVLLEVSCINLAKRSAISKSNNARFI